MFRSQKDNVAEWLRRQPAKLMGFARVGSNPTVVVYFAKVRDVRKKGEIEREREREERERERERREREERERSEREREERERERDKKK